MVILGIYEQIAKTFGDEVVAVHILPAMMPLLVEKSLSADQFATLINYVKGSNTEPILSTKT
jgi:hypothetical protein